MKVADALEGDVIARVVAIGKQVYWIEATPDGTQSSVLRHSTGVGEITKEDASSQALAVDADYVYYSGSSGPVRRQKHDGTGGETIAPLKFVSEIAVDGDAVFVVDDEQVKGKAHSQIWRIVKGSEPGKVVDADKISALTARGHRLYFLRDGKQIVGVNAEGKDEKVISDKAASLYVDDQYVYGAGQDGITRVAVAGGAPEQVIADPFQLIGGDAQRLFVLSLTTAGVFAIGKTTKAKTVASSAGALGLGVGADGLYLNQYKRLVRVPLP